MSQKRENTDWTVFIAIALIVLGGWLLMGRIFGPWWEPVRQMVRFAAGLAWPLALIAFGVLLLIGSKRGMPSVQIQGKRLLRTRYDKKVSGVLGGVARFLGVDPTLVRVGYVLFALISGIFPAIILYIAAAIVVPEEPAESPQQPVWPTGTSQPSAPPAAPAPETPPTPEAVPAPGAPPTTDDEPER